MLRLVAQLPPDHQIRALEFSQRVISIGRAPTNDLVVPANNVSSQHAQICLNAGQYLYKDLESTNGSILFRRKKKFLLKGERSELALEPGDRLFLASMENALTVDAIELEPDDDVENTILGEANAHATDLETSLSEDHDALRNAVRLARELSGLEAVHAIAELSCAATLRAFPRAARALVLVPEAGGYKVEHATAARGAADTTSTVARTRGILERCLAEHKGFLFLFQQNRMQAIATKISTVESLNTACTPDHDKVILCCPLLHNERCHGFLEVEAPLTKAAATPLTRRDLALATLLGHLVASRLDDLESRHAQLTLARKATAGFLAATVGHCFKNLLFVPMSLSHMIPLCLREGKLDELQRMLARNSVNIRYLDILSNEFAAASKDPSEGFAECAIDKLLMEVVELTDQIAPGRIEASLIIPEPAPRLTCHRAALRRLLMNLTLNSVDAFFGANKPETGRIEIRVDPDEANDEICLSIRDNGSGIPEPILKNLREIFHQVQASSDALGELQNIAERVHSTKDLGFKEHYGLGYLFVCQTVHAHEGRLEIDSVEGQGTCFRIILPRHRSTTVGGGGTDH